MLRVVKFFLTIILRIETILSLKKRIYSWLSLAFIETLKKLHYQLKLVLCELWNYNC